MLEHELKLECEYLAKTIILNSLYNRDSESEVLSKLYFKVEKYINYCENFGRNPQIVIHAIRYLRYTHAFQEQATLDTYLAMLDVLIELAVPFVKHTKDSIIFLDDIKEGISISKKTGSLRS